MYVAEVFVMLVKVPLDADQVTPAALTSFVTVAVTGRAWVMVRPPRLGEMVTLIVAVEAVTVIVAEARLVVSLTDVAVRVTAGFAGTEAGAV
jgi:hypothetical protein